jgi:delta1-piperideine-2-carboxylate reductase
MATETSVSAGLDGGGQLGYVEDLKMTEIAIHKARERGMTLIGARNCVYTGRNGFYVKQIARRGLVGLMLGNISPLVAPWGSNEALLGTNPFSAGIPTDERPFVLDIGTSSLMGKELRKRAIEHEPSPAGIGFDAEGSPTTDPEEALQGAVTEATA